MSLERVILYLPQRLIKGFTPEISATRINKAKLQKEREIQMSESSARLLKSASFLTNNTSSFNIVNP